MIASVFDVIKRNVPDIRSFSHLFSYIRKEMDKMPKKKTHEQFLQEVYDLVKDEYTVLGIYQNTHTKLLIRHNCEECNNFEYPVTPKNFIKGARCPKCSGRMKKTNEEFINQVYKQTQDEYSILEEYKGTHTKIMFKHNICGNEFPMQPFSFLQGHRCPECMKELVASKKRKTIEQFKQEVFNLVNNEYSVLSNEYKNNNTYIEFRHNICNRKFKMVPNSFLHGTRCPKCDKDERKYKKRKSHEQFVQEVYNLVGNEYEIMSQYENNRTYVQIKHSICGNIYPVVPDSFLGGRRCPICAESRGEQYSRKYFEPQKKFKGLLGLGGGLLSYDFYLPEYNLLYEFQGLQHEKYVKGFHKTEADFLKQQEHDRRKKEYAEQNEYNFLEIWYKDFDNIETILNEYLNNLIIK